MDFLVGSVLSRGRPSEVARRVVQRVPIAVSSLVAIRRCRPVEGGANRPVHLPVHASIRVEGRVEAAPAVGLETLGQNAAGVAALCRAPTPRKGANPVEGPNAPLTGRLVAVQPRDRAPLLHVSSPWGSGRCCAPGARPTRGARPRCRRCRSPAPCQAARSCGWPA